MYVCIYIYIYICMYVCVYIYIYIYKPQQSTRHPRMSPDRSEYGAEVILGEVSRTCYSDINDVGRNDFLLLLVFR